MIVQEFFNPVVCPANTATAPVYNDGIGGFFCTVAGTITLAIGGTTYINAMAVEVGVYYPFPALCHGTVTLTTAGGAAGVLFVD